MYGGKGEVSEESPIQYLKLRFLALLVTASYRIEGRHLSLSSDRVERMEKVATLSLMNVQSKCLEASTSILMYSNGTLSQGPWSHLHRQQKDG